MTALEAGSNNNKKVVLRLLCPHAKILRLLSTQTLCDVFQPQFMST